MSRSFDLTALCPRFERKRHGLNEVDVSLSKLTRLHFLLVNHDGQLNVGYEIKADERGFDLLSLHINGELNLRCGRCLESYIYPWQSFSTLLLETEESSFEGLGENDPYERVTLNHLGKLNLLDVVTDELIMALPQKHYPDCQSNKLDTYLNQEDKQCKTNESNI